MKKLVYAIAAMMLLLACEKENNNSQAVDLGLSVKWAKANLGATAPEDYGDYYAWGEIETKEDYTWDNYKWNTGSGFNFIKYNSNGSEGTVDNKTELDAADDVVRVKLGGKWRMPTSSELEELISTRDNNNYQWQWTSVNGHYGWQVTYLVNNNNIFLPAAGCKNDFGLELVGVSGTYWSSSLCTDNPHCAGILMFSSYNEAMGVKHNYAPRYTGISVRPVSE